MKYQVTFSLKNAMYPLTEVIEADSIAQAHQQLKLMIKQAGYSLKQILSTIQL